MSDKKDLSQGVSRRKFIASTAAAAVTAGLASRARGQQPAYAKPAGGGPWTRVSLTDPAAPAMLASYQTAITALLKMSPNDGRNFYRNAMVHLFDCPHGNWWFLPWHRGYLGFWEQTVRELSGNPSFAFPYWDWTVQPFVPDAFWQGVLDPSNSAFISDPNVFSAQLTPAITAYYNAMTPAQKAATTLRGIPDANSCMQAAVQQWFDPSTGARTLTQQNPNFDPSVQQTVSLPTIESALATPYFAGGGMHPQGGFGSDIVKQHYLSTTKGILESQPHDNVHDDTGGFMAAFLSPLDPIFMAHHSNIDRLWTVWTAQQQAAGQPTTPTGAELTQWQKEAFLFYWNSQGTQVSPSTCANYIEIGSFNYTYTQGSGATTAQREGGPRASASSVRKVAATVKQKDMNLSKAAVAQVTLPTAARESATPQRVRAHITIQPPPNPMGVRYHVLVNPPENALAIDPHHPAYAGTIQFFGVMDHAHPMTFTVPLDNALQDLRNAGLLRSDQITIHVIPQTRGVALRALPPTAVTNVEITTY